MTSSLQNQFLAYPYAKQLHDARILFKGACAWYKSYNPNSEIIITHDEYVVRFGIVMADCFPKRDLTQHIIAAPNLQDLIGSLPEFYYIEDDCYVLKIEKSDIYYCIRYANEGLDRCMESLSNKDPKIACFEMLLLLNDKGHLTELNPE